MNTQKQIFLIVVLFFVMTGGCAAYAFIEPVRSERQAGFFDAESARRGALLYANNCRTCHGNVGDGSNGGGIGLPLNTEDFKNQDPLILQANQAKIRHTLSCGRAGTAMPVWLKANGGALTEIQIEHLINLITSPYDMLDEEGEPTTLAWEEALEFAHNLNSEIAVVVGGDTLDTIARAHQLGYAELAAANNVEPDHVFERGDRVTLPDGRRIEMFEDRALTRVADDNHVGAILLAELNGIEWEVEGTSLHILVDGEQVTGLFPGDELALPEGAVYIVRAGDTLASISDVHGISVPGLRNANRENENIQDAAVEDALEHQRTLGLPSDAVAIVQPGQTAAIVATIHGLELEALLEENGIEDPTDVAIGQELELPSEGFRYIIQTGDTLASVAAAHGIDEADLAEENDLEPGDAISPLVVINLPPIDGYVVQGQDLAAVADGYQNVSAASLAEANEISADALLRIGSPLHLPDDAWGAKPSTATTSGEICIKNAISQSAYEGLFAPVEDPTAPEEISTEVEIVGNANDWTVVADGEESDPNRGAVTVSSPTDIVFRSAAGLHSITVNREKAADDISSTGEDEQTVTFEGDPGTEFLITCIYHPSMKAWVFIAP
ncbi:MAG TPA: LysM peptidoglycan-binding domain-containing protein [Tepidiformaceae bacterium]|nr:LysM peptidoglycan-binding domain-containing protein [Tepidiformaceae bacterium]